MPRGPRRAGQARRRPGRRHHDDPAGAHRPRLGRARPHPHDDLPGRRRGRGRRGAAAAAAAAAGRVPRRRRPAPPPLRRRRPRRNRAAAPRPPAAPLRIGAARVRPGSAAGGRSGSPPRWSRWCWPGSSSCWAVDPLGDDGSNAQGSSTATSSSRHGRGADEPTRRAAAATEASTRRRSAQTAVRPRLRTPRRPSRTSSRCIPGDLAGGPPADQPGVPEPSSRYDRVLGLLGRLLRTCRSATSSPQDGRPRPRSTSPTCGRTAPSETERAP